MKRTNGKGKADWSALRDLLPYLRPRASMLGVLALGIAMAAASLFGPWLVGKAIDAMTTAHGVDFARLFSILGILAALYAIGCASQWLIARACNRYAYTTSQRLRDALFLKVGHLSIGDIDGMPRGDMLSRMIADIEAIADGLQQGLLQLFTNALTLVGTAAFMAAISPAIALVVAIVTPVSILVARFVVGKSNAYFKGQSATLGALNACAEEMLGNAKTLYAYGAGDDMRARFEACNAELYRVGQKAQFYSSLTNPATRFVNNMAYVAVGVIGALSAIAVGAGGGAALTVGGIASLLTYATQFAKPINEITSVTTQLQAAMASSRRVLDRIDMPSEPPDREGARGSIDVRGEVAFRDVAFSYDPGVEMIHDLNLRARPSERIAIVGPTGAGKTTLVNLLMRFYEVDGGAITLDGVDVRDIRRDALRRSFGMVLQETALFAASVAENIAYGKPDATRAQIEDAARQAHADGFIRRLPQGYDTQLDEDGGNLSQGQRQLLTIARAMLADAPMLILDEATSNIDTRTEMRVQSAFARMMKGRTSFVIAHRLSTIRDADEILVMEDGRIIEQGTHDALIEKGGFYKRLYESQFGAG